MDKLQKIIEDCSEQAQELIDFGNSKEQREGYGMRRVIDEIIKLKKEEQKKPNTSLIDRLLPLQQEMDRVFLNLEIEKLKNQLLFTEKDIIMAMGYASAIDKNLSIETMEKECLNYINELKLYKNGGK